MKRARLVGVTQARAAAASPRRPQHQTPATWTGSAARVQARHTMWPFGSRSRVRVPSRRRGAQATTVQPSRPLARS